MDCYHWCPARGPPRQLEPQTSHPWPWLWARICLWPLCPDVPSQSGPTPPRPPGWWQTGPKGPHLHVWWRAELLVFRHTHSLDLKSLEWDKLHARRAVATMTCIFSGTHFSSRGRVRAATNDRFYYRVIYINWLIFWPIKHQKKCIPKHKVMSSNVFCCPTNSLKLHQLLFLRRKIA